MSEIVYVRELPPCNFCGIPAQYDSALIAGAWAYLCTEHWHAYTNRQLGVGLGQRLKVRKNSAE